MYAHSKLVVDECGEPEAYEINYITYYAYNGHYDLPAGLPLFRTGHHVGDWEHLTVRLDAATLELQGVWYNAHRNIEGEWVPARRVPRSPCGRILGYVAINGHGVYPTCGTIPRLFFLANDRTSSRGPVWNPARLVRLCGLAHGSACPIVPTRGCSLPAVVAVAARATDPGSPPVTVASARVPAHTPAWMQPPRVPTAAAGSPPAAPEPAPACAARGGGPGTPGPDGDDDALFPAAVEMVHLTAAAAPPPSPGRDRGSNGVAEELGKAAPSAAAAAAAAATRSTAAAGAGDLGGGGGSARVVRVGAAGVGFPLPAVVHDASPWQRYTGRWGTIVSATEQGWFRGPEPPVSRGLLRRLFLPCAAGVDRLPSRRRAPQGTAGPAPAAATAAAGEASLGSGPLSSLGTRALAWLCTSGDRGASHTHKSE
ncbi:hypothetical protein GPECTOR_43g917 [Gonium pectorale]|uniref:Uncharacterized protein n=1 Tax=Gonium pectorale TaxID=33097 RepID=A0A150G9H3_GONPE|nr:hypothetical protein GPECTOR_43g917 [Gonium pectorale]|eukprot:KXZ46481.1 hypothetical protein GPECTOR_43g917 [Gonium pectorale]